MGRTKYSEEERKRIIIHFLQCTREIINFEGIDQVSIRKVAEYAGCNSATIYLYFENVDELITLASMGYLENYCRTLTADMPLMKTSYEAYLHTWRVFSFHAFSSPKVFYHLFFHPHSKPLSEMIARYYKIYPNQVGGSAGPIHDMLLEGELEARNMKVLRPVAEECHLDEEETVLINDLTICYFKKLLEEHGGESGAIATDRATQRMMDAICFLMKHIKE